MVEIISCVVYSQVLAVDFYAKNGVVHLVDRVLFPPPQFKKEIPTKKAAKSSKRKKKSKLSTDDVRIVLKTKPQLSTQG